MKGPSAEPEVRHLAHLDGLRGLTALYVVLHHAFLTVWPIDLGRFPHGLHAVLTGWLEYGHYAVVVFIVLSGFVLTLPVISRNGLRGGAMGFYLGRVKRILPAYYASMILSAILIWLYIGQITYTHWDVSIPIRGRDFVDHGLLFNNWLGSAKINHVYWSIAVEWQIYLLFPILVWLLLKFGPAIAVLFAGIVGYGGAYLLPKVGFPAVHPEFLFLFAIGLIGTVVTSSPKDAWVKLRSSSVWPYLLAGSTLLFVTMLVWFGWRGLRGWVELVAELAVALAAVSLLVLAEREGSTVRAFLSRKNIVWLGTFSYSLYLIHAPLLQVIWQLLVPKQLPGLGQLFALLLIGIPVILLASYGFFRLFERPFMSARQRTAVDAEGLKAAPR